jgi:hypothetical protein
MCSERRSRWRKRPEKIQKSNKKDLDGESLILDGYAGMGTDACRYTIEWGGISGV